MKTTLRIFGLAALALSAMALAAQAGFTIARNPKEGELTKFRLKAELEFQGTPITFTGLVQDKVVKVTEDSFTVETSQMEGKINFGGQEMDAPTGGTSTITYARGGLIREITGDAVDGGTYRMAILGSLIEPGKAVNVGDTWTHEFKADAKTGMVAARAEYTVLGEEKVGEWDTVKLKISIRETEGTEPASSEATAWVSKTDGNLVKMEAQWTNAPFPGAPAPINAKVVMNREA